LGKVGLDEWDRVTAELENMGIMATADRGALVVYCEAWEEFVDLLAKVRQQGAVVYTDKGNAIQNPLLGAKNKAAERLLKTAAQFGMTPAARAKIEVTEKREGDAFAQFAGLRLAR